MKQRVHDLCGNLVLCVQFVFFGQLACSAGAVRGVPSAKLGDNPSPKTPPLALEARWEPAETQRKTSDAPAALSAAPEPPKAPESPPRPHSTKLRSGFFNPMPGGVFAGYEADTGLDIAGSPRPVFALAAGTLDYSEPGHTLWTGPSDTANCIRFELDTPIPYQGRLITHVYYAHLSRLETLQHEGEGPRRHVEAGELLGVSGVARGSPHLHVGFLLDGDVTQYWGTFLRAGAIRAVLGGYRNGERLPGGNG